MAAAALLFSVTASPASTAQSDTPDAREKLTGIGFDVVTSTPEAFQRYIASELVKWRKVAKDMGLKPG